MKNFFFVLCCTALAFSSCAKRLTRIDVVNIIPNPISVQQGEGVFNLTPKTKIILLSDDSMLNYSVRQLNALLDGSFKKALSVAVATQPQDQAINLSLDGALAAEEYTLNITPAKVEIKGGSPAGVFYGAQSLRQLMPQAVAEKVRASQIELPVVAISDKPHFAYRGAMLDVGRHFYTVDEVKHFIDIEAMHKLNRFHWHLTEDQGWRIEIKKYPELTRVGAWRERSNMQPDAQPQQDPQPYGGFYTQDQIREVVRYAAERFITIVPEIEMPGHASAALASYPFLGCKGKDYKVPSVWGVKEDVYCAGKDSTFQFLEDVLSEVVALFPSEYIHIGGDECPKTRWHECPLCQQRIKDEKLKDEAELQSYFIHRIESFLNSKGKKLIGWDEILEGGLSNTASVMSWRGAAGGVEAAKKGNYVVMSPNSHCYLDYYQTDQITNEPKAIGGYLPVEKVYSFDPYEGLNANERQYILGVQGNLWTEFISTMDHAEYMLLPRLAALSEVGWSYEHKDPETFKRRLSSLRHLYDAYGYKYGKHYFGADTTVTK